MDACHIKNQFKPIGVKWLPYDNEGDTGGFRMSSYREDGGMGDNRNPQFTPSKSKTVRHGENYGDDVFHMRTNVWQKWIPHQ